ncbi:hypothetical protein [Streptomyces sp. NPDC046631]|uniref:hypothetical protein n=1 Tax=unclassified Streptomyces TaxID=2593676 RepID=UPI0033E98175
MSVTVTTAAAAAQADVTTATIRIWCRRGVVAAVKKAGRWAVSTVSLARRIAIGAMRHRRMTGGAPVIDLSTTMTYTIPEGPTKGARRTLKIRRRTQADGTESVSLRALLPLFAEHIAEADDPIDRFNARDALDGATIVYSETPSESFTPLISTRDNGRIRTTYRGSRALSVDEVLDFAEQIRDQVLQAQPTPRAPRGPAPAIRLEHSTDWRAGRHRYVVTGPADTLRAAYESKSPVTVTGDFDGDRLYLGATTAVYGDNGITNQPVALLGKKDGIATYVIDERRLSEAPRLRARIDRDNAELGAADARQAAADNAYLDSYYD